MLPDDRGRCRRHGLEETGLGDESQRSTARAHNYAADRPGVVGTIGRILGEAGVNIAGMQVARTVEGGEALVALTVDQTIPQPVLAEITEEIGATSARAVNLVD